MSQEYIAALAIVIVGTLKAFNINIGTSEITSILTAALGIYVMYRRYQKGDIKLSGVRR